MTKQRKKGATDNSFQILDEYHNQATPCSSALERICAEIFPEFFDDADETWTHNTHSIISKQYNSSAKEDGLTLGQVVRSHLVEQRRRQIELRELPPAEKQRDRDGSKKRKKNKKKKKILEQESEAVNMTTDAVIETTVPMYRMDSHLNEYNFMASSSSLSSSSSPNTCTIDEAEKIEIQVNCMLDQILHQTQLEFEGSESSSSKVYHYPDIPKNRQLPAFFIYLQTRFANYHQNLVKKGGTRHNTYPTDIIPTFSLTDISHACTKIKCHACKDAALQHVRQWTQYGTSATTSPTGSTTSSPSPSSSPTADPSTRTDIHIRFFDSHRLQQQQQQQQQQQSNANTNVNPNLNPLSSYYALTGSFAENFCLINPASIQVDSNNHHHHRIPIFDMTTFHTEFPMDEQAFDYAAMEEGQEPTSLTCSNKWCDEDIFGLLLRVIDSMDSPPRKNLQLVPLSPLSIQNCEIANFPLSLEQSHEWIRTIIIPCGLKSLEKFKVDSWLHLCQTQWEKYLSKEEIYLLFNRAQSLHSFLHERLTSTDDRMREMNYTGPFTSMSSNDLQSFEFKCKDYFVKVGKFLFLLHRRTMDARVETHGYQRWLENIIDRLWELYETALDRVIIISTEYRWKVRNLAKSPGSIPIGGDDSLVRQYFCEMLSKKVEVIDTLRHKLGEILSLSNAQDNHITNLIRLAILSVLFSANNRANSDEHDEDAEYYQLLHNIMDSVCDTIDVTNYSEIFRRQNIQRFLVRDTVISHCRRMVHFNENMKCILGPLNISWYENMIFLEENLEKLNKGCKYTGVDDFVGVGSNITEEKEMKDILTLSHGVNRLQRVKDLVDCVNDKSRMETGDHNNACNRSSTAIDITLITLKGIFENSNMVLDKRSKNAKHYCSGKSGRRRISCIISELLYDWLSERFLEFHADVTQTELLHSIEKQCTSVNNSAVECITNIPRKQNRKKDKKTMTNSSKGRVDSDCTDDNDEILENGKDINKALNIKVANINLATIVDKRTQIVDESSFVCMEFDGGVGIGVTDGEEFMLAKDFLIGRYDEIVSSYPFPALY